MGYKCNTILKFIMGKSKELFNQQRESEIQNDPFLDDDYQYNQWKKSRERDVVSSRTLDATEVLTDLFKSFGEIFTHPQFREDNASKE